MDGHIITAVATAAASLGGFQSIKYILNYGSGKRISAAEAFSTEYKAMIEDYHRVQREVDAAKDEIRILNKKVDGLYKQVHALESERLDLLRENGELKLALKEATHNVCIRTDADCQRRLPPRDYCAMYKNGMAHDRNATARREDANDNKDEKNGTDNQSTHPQL